VPEVSMCAIQGDKALLAQRNVLYVHFLPNGYVTYVGITTQKLKTRLKQELVHNSHWPRHHREILFCSMTTVLFVVAFPFDALQLEAIETNVLCNHKTWLNQRKVNPEGPWLKIDQVYSILEKPYRFVHFAFCTHLKGFRN
jgi:hypothetical protein